MRLQNYITEAKGDTSLTTFTHEIATGIFLVKPGAKLVTGADISKYMIDEKIITPAKTTETKNVTPLDIVDIPQHKFLSPGVILPQKQINDAKKLADKIGKQIGKPDGGRQVYWTGPTNDSSKYGAADITYISDSKVIPVSLKYGKGQLKNLGLNTLSEILFKGILPQPVDMNKIIYSKTSNWNDLTREWLSLIYQQLTSNKQFDEAQVISKYLSLSYKEFLKKKLPKIESDIMINAKYLKPTDKSSLKQSTARIYSANKSMNKPWQQTRSEAFDKLFNQYFSNKEGQLNKNLLSLFKQQMSVGKGDMWYAAEGGKKILFIPNETTFNNMSKSLTFDYSSSSSNIGYTMIVIVKSGNDLIIKITINIRYAQGQMMGAVTTKSSMSGVTQERWNKIFMEKTK